MEFSEFVKIVIKDFPAMGRFATVDDDGNVSLKGYAFRDFQSELGRNGYQAQCPQKGIAYIWDKGVWRYSQNRGCWGEGPTLKSAQKAEDAEYNDALCWADGCGGRF